MTLNAANGYTANVTVTLTDDLESEGDETASFQIATITGPGVLGSPAVHVLTLLANDTGITFASWAAANNVTNSLTANDDGDKFLNGEEYAFDLDPNVVETGNVLASETILSGGNVTLTLAFTGNSAKTDIDYVVRRSATPDFTGNTLVGTWNGTNNWTTDAGEIYVTGNSTTGGGDEKAVNVELTIPVGTVPRQFLDVEIQ
ncbi:MAG: hypothetical protein HC901_02165 [Bdellovibrionaceae bacterium]|nr:hypothetical protein [Pseudobdellovibrionaceae bacterium]